MPASELMESRAQQGAGLSAVPLLAVIQQHAEDAVFLTSQRQTAVDAPHLKLPQLLRLDERLEANLDGLIIAGEHGWECLLRETPLDNPAAIFSAACFAVDSGNTQRIDMILSSGIMHPDLRKAFIAALGFVHQKQATTLLQKLLDAHDAPTQALALLGCAEHPLDPGERLRDALMAPELPPRFAAFEAAGVLGRTDLAYLVLRSLQAPDPDLRTCAAWTAARLGVRDQDVLQTLRVAAQGKGLWAVRALGMALRCLPLKEARGWVEHLWQAADVRLAAQATALLGDATLMPAVLKLLDEPKTARLAAEAFSTLTGITLKDAALEGPRPEGFEPGPNDDPADPDVAPDPDEGLPWPAGDRIRVWWSEHESQFLPGVRYFCGQSLTRQTLVQVLNNGFQRQRRAAALELAILYPAEPMFPTHARARHQRVLLGRLQESS